MSKEANKKYKLMVHVPPSHAEAVRTAMGDAGAGTIGNYSHCSFSVKGIGRFKGNAKSTPAFGQAGGHEQIEEECIEVSPITSAVLKNAIKAMIEAHPYEEVAYQILELIDLEGIV